jgi:hypothetical protein
MTFRMAGLKRTPSGSYAARKGIPKDVQEQYGNLYGQRHEAKLTLPASLTLAKAKARHAEWLREVQTRIATIRARQHGERQSLTQRQAVALAGEWYQWWLEGHEKNPGTPEQWQD